MIEEYLLEDSNSIIVVNLNVLHVFLCIDCTLKNVKFMLRNVTIFSKISQNHRIIWDTNMDKMNGSAFSLIG